MTGKLLVVDDDADLRKALRLLLEGICELREAGDGREALEIIKAERPALMLLDIAMPGMSGLEVLAAARLIEPDISVIMLTGERRVEPAQLALESGAVVYMTKPFEQEALRREVRRLLAAASEDPRRDGKPPWRLA